MHLFCVSCLTHTLLPVHGVYREAKHRLGVGLGLRVVILIVGIVVVIVGIVVVIAGIVVIVGVVVLIVGTVVVIACIVVVIAGIVVVVCGRHFSSHSSLELLLEYHVKCGKGKGGLKIAN